MIKTKARPAVPPTLTSETVRKFKESLKKRVDRGEKLKSKDFRSAYWRKDDVVGAIWNMHRGKCCYCERKRDPKRESDVEHFRPKSEVTGKPEHPGYWWLAYEWSNYFFSCKSCNQEYKLNHFPLIDEEVSAKGPDDDLEKERPYLINPANEDPEEFITFDWKRRQGNMVKVKGIDGGGRGETTKDIVGLNRPELMDERGELVGDLQKIGELMKLAKRYVAEDMVRRLARMIRQQTVGARRFAGFRRAFFLSVGLGEYMAKD